MPRIRLSFAVLVASLSPAVASAQSSPNLSRFLHPNAKAVISINWTRLRESHLAALLREKWAESKVKVSLPGMELLNSVGRLLISSPGRNPADDASEPPLLLVVGGHFDLAQVRGLLATYGFKPQKFNSFQVYRAQGPNAKDVAIVLFDAETILVGDPPSLFASLERNTFPQPPPEPHSLLARAAEMEANYDFWIDVTAPDVMASDRLSSLVGGAGWASEAKSFDAGISLRSGLAADVTLNFEDEEAAKKVAAAFAKLTKLAVKDKANEPALQELQKKLKFTSEGAVARISLRLTPQELERNARVFAATHRFPAASTSIDLRPAVKSSPQLPPPKSSVIRIEGLDGGTKEIPFHEP